ncbi:hypothetical protein Tco_0877042 [Tanacetum coccineum]|uniref:Reverse transcriptase domain-containing protein n=1 Tax=Tanacetum coccineum TaxID=301880 RepID=A0ABQ5BTZ9_9ASTR
MPTTDISTRSLLHGVPERPDSAKVSTSTSTPGISFDVAELKDMVKALLLDKKNQSPAPTPVKAKTLKKYLFLKCDLKWANPTSLRRSKRLYYISDFKKSISGDSDFLLFEEADSFLAIEDDPTSPEVDPTYYDPDGDILLLEAILNSDPSPPPPNQGNYFPETRKDLKICEANNENSSVNEPPEVELKDLPPHLEYAFLEGNDKLPVIIAKDLKNEEKARSN